MYSWQIFPGVKLSDSGPYAVHKSRTSLKYHRLPPRGNAAAAPVHASARPLREKDPGPTVLIRLCVLCCEALLNSPGRAEGLKHTQACFPQMLPRDPLGEGWSGQDARGPEIGEKGHSDNMFVLTCFPGVEEGNFPLQGKYALSYWELLLLIGMQNSVL